MTAHALLLYVMHALITLLEVIYLAWRKLLRGIRVMQQGPNGGGSREVRKLATILERLPVHLGIVNVEDDLSMSDIARVVVWSAALGVAYVSVFDHKGRCSKLRQAFQRALDQQRFLFEKSTSGEHQLLVTLTDRTSFVHSGDQSPPVTTRVRLIGPDDGRKRVVDVARQLNTEVAKQRMSRDDVTVTRMDAMMQEDGFCDPDLVIRFGKVNSLLGFLPWQIRLSEIMFVPTLKNIDLHDFGEVLQAYCSTEQRCGK